MKESFKNRALENIKAAESCFEQEFYNASANRAYYAAFHAAISAIFSIGIDTKIEHRPVHSIFTDNYFNRRKIISSKYKGYLGELQRKRNIADYKSGVGKKEAKEQLNNAKEFVEIILMVIK